MLFRSTSENLPLKRYVAAGNRAYIVGTQNGDFPPMGWHIQGAMGGVWAHPIRLLEGYWFTVNGTPLTNALTFTSGTGYVKLEFPPVHDTEITRVEFGLDDTPAVLIGLTLHNLASVSRDFDIQCDVKPNLIGAYPWSWSRVPHGFHPDGNITQVIDGTLIFQRRNRAWAAAVGCLPAATSTDHGFRWQLGVPPQDSLTVWIGVAGSTDSVTQARAALDDALRDPSARLRSRQADRQTLLDRSRITTPDPHINDALQWGKLNLADLRIDVGRMIVRDVHEGRDYPEPAGEIDDCTGIGAGYPDYMSIFGVDGLYTVFPLVASGQIDTALGHLRLLRQVSRLINDSSGKIVHEITPDGSVYYGTNRHSGNTNETLLYALAVEFVWQWTGAQAVFDEHYTFVCQGLRTFLGTGHWPHGRGIVERDGMGPCTLDNAVYGVLALQALTRMAAAAGDINTHRWAERRAGQLAATFEDTWWMTSESLYADSLNVSGRPQQSRHWTVVSPMAAGIAAPDHAAAALSRLESADFSHANGLYHTGIGGLSEHSSETRIWTLPNALMAIAEANYGRTEQALRYLNTLTAHIDLEMPGAFAEMLPGPGYDPFQDMHKRLMFMQAWSSVGLQWLVIRYLLGIQPALASGQMMVAPLIPEGWRFLRAEQVHVGTGILTVHAERDGGCCSTTISTDVPCTLHIGAVLPPHAVVRSVAVNGSPSLYTATSQPNGLLISVTIPPDDTGRISSQQVTVETVPA